MKALVTGGAGFLGRYLVRELQARGTDTIAFDRVFPPGDADAVSGVSVVCGDILDMDCLKTSMQGCDIVIHTAAIADIDEARAIPVKTMEVNVVGTAKCLQAAVDNGVRRFLFASSVYTSGTRGSFYRVSKQAGESLCRSFSDEYALPYTILKYGSLYGRDANHWNFIYNVCKALLADGKFHYSSSPDAVREFIHIRDAARETVRIAMDPDFANKSVLITGHQRLQMRELFETIQEILGKKITITYAPANETRHYVRTPYSFEPEVPLRVNLSTYVDIYEGILDCFREAARDLEKQEQGGTLQRKRKR
ncbi:MAG: NAD(P)-dependent oxidoreductase [Methanomicrobiales archaeon]|nr:NAD(P)-dependent oxidoreductase [Methanomicrobiales archaeon]